MKLGRFLRGVGELYLDAAVLICKRYPFDFFKTSDDVFVKEKADG